VDVFFVISGYLISATILAEVGKGQFSLSGFYERRIRRIFPALLAMLLGVTALAYHYLLPSELEHYAWSLLTALVSGSNFLFWHEGGYFDQVALKPLLHTWSLGVEEQFYILFPIFLVLVRRWFPQRLRAAVMGIAVLSFIAAWITVPWSRPAAFFFAPLRAWELLLGTIVSQHYLPSLHGGVSRNLASGVGLLLILVPAWVYDGNTAFPGLAALPPCLGAAMIIAAGETGSSAVGRILAWRPVAFIGLISYSLYLWHWPFILFQSAGGMLVPSMTMTRNVKLTLAAASIAAGAVSWKFVEQPFRKGNFRPGRSGLFATTGLASLALAGLAFGILVAHGMPWRFSPDVLNAAKYLDRDADPVHGVGTCFLGPENTFADFDKLSCLGTVAKGRSILIFGDSHAAMLRTGLSTVFPDWNLEQASASDCAPLVKRARPDSANCKRLLDYIFRDYLLHYRVGILMLEARWRKTDIPSLEATIDYARVHSINVVLMGPSIEYDKPEPRLIAFALRDGQLAAIQSHIRSEPRMLDREIAELAHSRWHVPYISIYEDVCRPKCPAYADGLAPLLADGNHLSAEGSILLAKAIRANGQIQ
jgi:peptidoglycan/LPS O-acetylase OafA/YrhL